MHLVCYDIREPKRLMRVAKILLDFGTRVQYSVFECSLTEKQLALLQQRLKTVMKMDEDSVRFYRLCESCCSKAEVLGEGTIAETPEVYIV